MTSSSGPRPRPSAAWFLLPVALLALTVVVVRMTFPDGGVLAPVTEARCITLPGEAEVDLERPGRFFIYHESGISPDARLRFTVTPVGASEPLALDVVPMGTTYTNQDREFRAITSFEMEKAGRVRVTGAYAEGVTGESQTVVVGPSLEIRKIFGSVFSVIVCIGIAVLGFILVALSTIIIIIKRVRTPLLPAPPRASP